MPYTPRGKYFDDYSEGALFETASRTITESDVSTFAGLSGDYNPLHTDEEFMKNSQFGGRIAHGMLLASIATGLANQSGIFEGTSIAVLEITLKWTAPVRFGDTVHLLLKVAEKKESSKGDKGTVVFNCELLNQRNEKVMDSRWTVLLKKTPK
ncbi:MAG: MaoC/PaaZ C-terminal domain-containing protein [Planctomycetota bacterium]